MVKKEKPTPPQELYIPLKDFLVSFNQNMPASFSKVTEAQLIRFKEEHTAFFKHGNLWSLDQHRKKVIDWLQQSVNLRVRIES